MHNSQLAWRAKAPAFTPILGFTIVITLISPCTLPGQTSNTASIEGKVRGENGAGVRAVVTAASGPFVQRAFAGSDGSFQFTKLPAGSYSLCAQTSPMEAGPKDDPFVDSCAWQDLSLPRLTLGAGQAKTGVSVNLKRGYLLKIRVNDPGKMLPASLPASLGKLAGNPLSLLLSGPSGLLRSVPVNDRDDGGRTHAIVIPYDTPHKLFVHSATVGLKDGNGRAFVDTAPIMVQVSHGGPPPAIVVNVVQAVKQ